jgi:hypothetical protein
MGDVRERFLNSCFRNWDAGIPNLRSMHEVILVAGDLQVTVESRADDKHEP